METNTLLVLNEKSIRSLDNKFDVCFSVDDNVGGTNFMFDPYFKFYPDSSSVDKNRNVYRIHFLNPPGWTKHSSRWITPETMSGPTKKLLISALSSAAIYSYRDREGKMVDVSTTVWGALCLLCDEMHGTHLHGKPMPDYNNIKFQKSRTAEKDEEKEEKTKNDKSNNKSRTSRSRK